MLHMIDCVCPLLEDYIGTPSYTRQYSPEKTAMLADYLEKLTELGLVSNDTEAPWQDAQRLRTLRHYVHDYGAACKTLIDSERRKNTQASSDVGARQLARF